jgi:heterodisulfide reductase subunit B2
MKLGYYPGCSLTSGSREYHESVEALAKAFDIELIQVPDWNCCGATAAHNLNKTLSLSLPARILALAEENGLNELVVPCAACYNRLTMTQHELTSDKKLSSEVSTILKMPLGGKIEILNVIQFIQKYITPALPVKITHPFSYKVACYYGCLLVRPHDKLSFDRSEDPQTMDMIAADAGAKAIDWPFKTECCGAGLSMSRTETVARLSGKIVSEAVEREAEAIVVACPMCQSNLDMRRPEINKAVGMKMDIPVIYITQLLGLAVGIGYKELGLQRHFVPFKLKPAPAKVVASMEGETKTANLTEA